MLEIGNSITNVMRPPKAGKGNGKGRGKRKVAENAKGTTVSSLWFLVSR